jgi:hypothetical protein
LIGKQAEQIANDPPDRHFRSTTVAHRRALLVRSDKDVSPAAARIINHLSVDEVRIANLGADFETALERAEGAEQAGDATWQARQLNNAASAASALSRRLPALGTELPTDVARLKGAHVPKTGVGPPLSQALSAALRRHQALVRAIVLRLGGTKRDAVAYLSDLLAGLKSQERGWLSTLDDKVAVAAMQGLRDFAAYASELGQDAKAVGG